MSEHVLGKTPAGASIVFDPERLASGLGLRGDPLLPFETWAERKRVPAWKVAATRAHENWPAGREVTEADFDRALHQACHVALK